jgi:Ca-activated chloride channel family protein
MRVQVIAPDKTGPGTRLPLNLALVIDRSGSMSGTKLEKAKEAAIYCLRNLTGADRAAVIAYDDEVRVVSPSKVLTPETKNQMIADIRMIQSGGSTNLGGGWLTGAQEVANHVHEANYLSRAILLSDGLTNVGIVDPQQLEHHAEELRRRGVSTTTMGIGADFNEDLMERMAIKGGGHFYFIEDGRQIPDFLHRELGEVLSTVARRVTLELHLPSGVEASMLNTFEMDRQGGGVRVRLDDMIAGEVRSVLFKLTVRPGSAGVALALPVSLDYVDVESGESRRASSSEAVLTYATAGECAAEIPNGSVMEEVALLEAARAREEALKYDAAGDYIQSTATLARAATYLRTAAPASPVAQAEAALLDQESAQAPSGFAPMKRKEMHYDKSTRQQGRQK